MTGLPARDVLRHVARLIAGSIGLDPADLTPDDLERFASVDLLAGSAELAGRSIDSLAVAEILIDLDEELGISVLDQLEADLDADRRTVQDLAASVAASAPPAQLQQWLERT